MIFDSINLNEENNRNISKSIVRFLIKIENTIRNRRAVVATNISMGENLLASYWIIIILENTLEVIGGFEWKI